MALHDRIRKLTYDDYLLIPEDGQRHEILDGEHYVSPAPFLPHQDVSVELVWRFRSYLEEHPLGRIRHAPCDVILSKHDVVQPDLLFISNERAGIAANRKYIYGAPDLLVEILSEGTRDRDEVIKLDLYERAGVLEYWIFDPVEKTARIYRRIQEEHFQLVADLRANARDILSTPLLPGLDLPLAEIFR